MSIRRFKRMAGGRKRSIPDKGLDALLKEIGLTGDDTHELAALH